MMNELIERKERQVKTGTVMKGLVSDQLFRHLHVSLLFQSPPVVTYMHSCLIPPLTRINSLI